MSLDFIHIFQLKILNNLETLVREHVNQVYISVVEDGNYPFILDGKQMLIYGIVIKEQIN